jgi:hypothetical protein
MEPFPQPAVRNAERENHRYGLLIAYVSGYVLEGGCVTMGMGRRGAFGLNKWTHP